MAAVNKYAMENYDHTFTENLINVVRSEEQGLYQARPKTAFDKIVEQKHYADEMTAEYGAEISFLNKEIERYLILPEVTADKPVKLIAVFVTVLVFGLLLVAALLYELTKRVAATANAANEEKNEKLQIDTSGMSRLHQLVYEQYRADFKDFYLVYQPMKGGGENDREHLEALIRWRSDELGMVSPAKLIECIADFGIFPQLNDWIIKNVCADIFYIAKEKGRAPIVHINCPSGQLSDFALNDLII